MAIISRFSSFSLFESLYLVMLWADSNDQLSTMVQPTVLVMNIFSLLVLRLGCSQIHASNVLEEPTGSGSAARLIPTLHRIITAPTPRPPRRTSPVPRATTSIADVQPLALRKEGRRSGPPSPALGPAPLPPNIFPDRVFGRRISSRSFLFLTFSHPYIS